VKARAESLLECLEHSNSTRSRVETLLENGLHEGNVGVDAIARKLGLSRQTLFRKLRTDGVTFKQVLEELRHRLALDYLTAKKMSVNETAYLVGFSDPTSFSRAFKRWSGHSPSTIAGTSRTEASDDSN
jgi:AraC-like DNA-binding protein